MSGFTFSPALGWIAGGVIAALLVVLAVAEVVQFVRRNNAYATDETVWACVRRTLMLVVAALMVLTPSVVAPTTSRAINATDVIIAVDTTGSMAVSDAHYGSDETISRIEAARKAVHDVTASYSDASFAALRFGASGTLDVPLTPDAPAIDNWADTLSVESTSVSSGSSLDAPIDQLLVTAKSIRDAHPDDAIVLYLITDGEQTSNVARRSFSSLRQYVDDGFTVGVGSTQGGKIPVIADGVSAGDSSTTDQWVTDPDTGEPGISKMDETNLKDIADEISGTYIAVNESNTLAGQTSDKTSGQWRVTTTTKERTRTTAVVWPLAIVMAVLLACELGAWIAASRRLL
ncbi:von Willebrand factor, type A [Bifidobacterium saguini DSM 23967]|uniref:von Willebrand factor, type A n=2 Tax=Bifidobacterium saguini TaxID=762210 RepID=A0A087DBV7_9BIFI|nr:vWA domain-containing protein [Bifidobacterium saguini]KFI93007.1 von Willebrand factor, type A [Bifidobacterium saguini DSM 23967]QTB91352.1 VWA domain-containing protein [Bifidobacterium saguini]